VHAARRAQLDPAHAQRIIGITDDGDNALIALRACQAYVNGVLR
ncbi:lysis protein, partial [Pseudomonas tolaasii]